MSEKKPMPKCPYCGAEMRLEDNEDVLFGVFSDEEKMYWYQCNAPSCGIHSPANHTKAGAYKAAMKRYEEPNRVLTMDEVRAQRLVWAEYKERPTDIAKLLLVCWLKRYSGYDYFVVINEDGIYREGSMRLTKVRVYSDYHKLARFWWKEPTVEECMQEWVDGNE